MQKHKQKLFPWRQGCQFELLTDGGQFFPRLLQYIEQAETSIDIELYLVWSGEATRQVVPALCAAAQRGVKVRCLFDGTGSYDFEETERDELRLAGVELRFYNPVRWLSGHRNLHRDHRKLLIFDSKIVCTGGLGFNDEFCIPGEDGVCRWHDQMLVVHGEIVADWLALFGTSWETADTAVRFVASREPVTEFPEAPAAGLGRVAFSASRKNRDLLRSLVTRIRQAETRAWLATPYFVPPSTLLRALRHAARRGVDVRIQVCGQITDLPSVRYAGQIHYAQLLRAGVRIYEYTPCFLHLKSALVDDWATLGSCNFDHWTLHWNLEANQNALDPALAQAVEKSFENDFGQSKEWTLGEWHRLPKLHRMKILLWGRVKKIADLVVRYI